MAENKTIIIIGGGVAGMSAGIYAQKNGFSSSIIEKHTIAGGICTAWYRKGYKFDYSIQWLVGTKEGAFHDTMEETGILGKDVEVLYADVHNRNVAKDGSDFIIYTKLRKWRRYLLNLSPHDFVAINKLCRDIRRASTLKPFADAPALRTKWRYVMNLFKSFPSIYVALRTKGMSYRDYIESLGFKNEGLKTKLLNVYGEDNFASFAFLLIMGWYLKKNAGYPMGGSLCVAQRMHQKYESLGGKMLFKKEVTEIIVENNKAKGVRLEDGTVLNADYVVSTGDGYSTIYKLLNGNYITKKIENAYRHWELFGSIVQVSFGINKVLNMDYHVQVVLSKGEKIGSNTLKHSYRILNYGFDPSMSPQGKTAILIRFESPYEFWKKLNKEEYQTEKKLIENDARRLLEKNFPGVSEYIEICDVATPLTTVRYTGAFKGSYEGFLPTKKNIINEISQKLPNLDHFYMAGQWLFPGGGIPPSVQSGKWAIQLICHDEKKKFVSK